MNTTLQTDITYLKGVGPLRAKWLKEELNIHTYQDLLFHFPFRYQDRTQIYSVQEIQLSEQVFQLKGKISSLTITQKNKRKIGKALLQDATGTIPLVWLNGLHWIKKSILPNATYYIFGKPSLYNNQLCLVHPELTLATTQPTTPQNLHSLYPSTQKLTTFGLNSKGIAKLQHTLLPLVLSYMQENLPQALLRAYDLLPRKKALTYIHFPPNPDLLKRACARLKFEELFYLQLRLLQNHTLSVTKPDAPLFTNTILLKRFYHDHLPFTLTNAQKKVIRQITQDMASGKQMNRLLQGDVGSGKTMVAFLSLLLPCASEAQTAFIAPTEILAQQHYHTLVPYAQSLGISIALLTGSTTQKNRKKLHQDLSSGTLKLLVGTHALLADKVRFHNLGLAIIDEQHRFGVAQRAKLWGKNTHLPPHILIMTATPIPRTLAMSLYGDLDSSVIDELPAGRKPIKTLHCYQTHRARLYAFVQKELEKGKQIYVVYPLIEDSPQATCQSVIQGYKQMVRAFPNIPIDMLYGSMKPADKTDAMARFEKDETKIMVATTVIEVGLHVPNATIMIIEDADRFGLTQLHQLRGRVGRGKDPSYCILMTDYKLTTTARQRIKTMVRTTDGFEIAKEDLKIRGPGNLLGLAQSGLFNLKIADLIKDEKILKQAHTEAKNILIQDTNLAQPQHVCVQHHLSYLATYTPNWGKIS